MAEHNEQQTPDHDAAGYERRDVSIAKLAVYGIAGMAFLITLVIFMVGYFVDVHEGVVQQQVLTPESTQLRELRARETEKLYSYDVLNADSGIYQIPIERAMKVMADEAYQQRLTRSQ